VSSKNHNSFSAIREGTVDVIRPVERSSTACVIPSGAVFPAKRGISLAPPLSAIMNILPLLLLASLAFSQAMPQGVVGSPASVRPPYLQNVGIDQHLDAQIPPDLSFTDDAGHPVKLGGYFGNKPVILNLVYYNCPMLCGEVLAGLTTAMRMIKFDVGDQFDVVTVSFNPQETTADAAAKKKDFIGRYGRPGAASGWHFLTGSSDSINALTKAVGFQYQYDPKIRQYAHATAIMVLTPQGRISRYFYGVDFPPKDLRMGLVEASAGKIGNLTDQVLLYCYHYDPATGKYGAVITNILRLGAGITVVLLAGMILIFLRLEKSASRRKWSNVKVQNRSAI
jgi:protein SCO1